MYAFLAGPALWATFIVFFGGLLIRIIHLYRLSQKKDQVFFNHVDLKWGFKSILQWLIPWGSTSMRQQPVFTFMVFAFHISLLAVPLFFKAHNILWDESWGISLWSLPNGVIDAMTIILLVTVIFFVIRRLVRSEVRIITGAWDYVLLGLTALPFLTGLLAYHQVGPYETMMVLHLLTAHLILILIPFTKLAHMILFFFTRAFIGFEMGGRRGARSW